MRETARALRLALVVVASLIIVLSLAALAVFVVFPDLAEEYTAGLRPSLFYAPLPQDQVAADLEQEYEQVFGVAHNSGDSVRATLAALAAGADAIEVDVVSLDGELYSSHAPPLPWIGRRVFRGPPLLAIWTAAAQTDLVKFDLKESSPAFLELVADFVAAHRAEARVVVASADPAAHRFFAARAPDVLRFASVGDEAALDRLRADPELVAVIDGVTIRESLVDAETARWLEERGLRVLAWTVDDLGRANELIRLGVDAITTDNLALLALFGGQRRGERSLATAVPVATPVPATPEPATRSFPGPRPAAQPSPRVAGIVLRALTRPRCAPSGRRRRRRPRAAAVRPCAGGR